MITINFVNGLLESVFAGYTYSSNKNEKEAKAAIWPTR